MPELHAQMVGCTRQCACPGADMTGAQTMELQGVAGSVRRTGRPFS